MRVLAVIPAYNEEECLAKTVDELIYTCPNLEYIVINDGSNDGTHSIIESEKLHALELPVNTGLTSVFRLGMKYAEREGFDAVVQFDADGQHLPNSLSDMIEKMEANNSSIVIGSRYFDGKHKPQGARGLGSRLISFLIKLTTGKTITDPTSGLRLYNSEMIHAFNATFDLAPEPDMLVWVAKHEGKIDEVQVRMRERQGGVSYFSLSQIVRYMSRTCLSILLTAWLR